MHVVNLGWFFIDKPEFMDLQAKRLPGFMQNIVSMIFPVEYLYSSKYKSHWKHFLCYPNWRVELSKIETT